MNIILGYTILILGIISAIQTSLSFIAGDIYDIQHLKSIKRYGNKKYTPFISIVISAYNEEKVIYRSLQSIIASTYKKYEVIIVNDGSKDKTSEEVRRFIKDFKPKHFKLVEQVNAGKANGLNNGIKKYAKGNLIMCLDADSIISSDALIKVVEHFKDNRVIALATNVRIINDHTLLGILQGIEYLYSYRLKKARTLLNAEYIIGGVGSTFRKKILKECNYYDTDSLTEDIALTLKIINKKGNINNKIIYASDVACYTEGVGSIKALFKQRYRWKYGFLQALYKNKRLILNRSSKYSKFLAFYNLPLAVYSEVLSLLDPILILFVIYYTIRYNNMSLFIGMFAFLSIYTLLAIVTDEHLNYKEKLGLSYYIPISYIFFFVLGLIGDIALIKSLINYKGIFYSKNADLHTWDTVRTGFNVQPETI